jgi:hypothetical protein
LPVQWAERAVPVAAPAEATASEASAPETSSEEPQTKRRTRRPRRREEEPALEAPALETVGAESAAGTQVLERPQTEPANAGASVQVIDVGNEADAADGDQPRKRGWWRRLIE